MIVYILFNKKDYFFNHSSESVSIEAFNVIESICLGLLTMYWMLQDWHVLTGGKERELCASAGHGQSSWSRFWNFQLRGEMIIATATWNYYSYLRWFLKIR